METIILLIPHLTLILIGSVHVVGSVALGDFFVCLVVSMNITCGDITCGDITCGDITCGDITCAPGLSPQKAARCPTDQHLLSVH